jgi:hypothetical protein
MREPLVLSKIRPAGKIIFKTGVATITNMIIARGKVGFDKVKS